MLIYEVRFAHVYRPCFADPLAGETSEKPTRVWNRRELHLTKQIAQEVARKVHGVEILVNLLSEDGGAGKP